MEYRVLGPVEVADRDRVTPISSPRQRALLGLLVANAGRAVSTERILDELWGDEPPESGRQTVAFHVSQLRKSLDGGGAEAAGSPIETRDGGYRLAVPPEAIDAVRFERLVAAGEAALTTDPATAAERLTEALALWRGEPYEGLDEAPFAVAEGRRLGELRLRALEDRVEAELALGRAPELVGELTSLVDREPLREHLRSLLIVALYRSGRQADALRAYADGRRVLAEELGIDPGPELAALETAILRQDPGLLAGPLPTAAGPAVAGPPRNPYKGLRPFDEADAADFFGREALTTRLVTRAGEVARAGGLLAVVGPSGSGKSSVVRAGLVPALRAGGLPGSEAWPIAIMFPGARPFEELAAALRGVTVAAGSDPAAIPSASDLAADPGALAAAVKTLVPADRRLLLVIDQLEELWALVDGAECQAFLDFLAAMSSGRSARLLVVGTLRADQIDRALRSSALGPLLRDGTELVPPLDRDELVRAIERPAARAGLVLEPGLAETIVADVADHPAMLPPLQYALTELVDRATDGDLTRTGYAAIGGVVGALAARAEATYAALEPDAREATRQIFLRLVAVEPTGEASARRVLRAELADAGSVTDVLERFAAARLLALGRDGRAGAPTAEIAHEALLDRWPRLAGWVDAERDALWMRRRLGDAAAEWVEHDHDPGFLLAGARLEVFATWAAATDLTLGLDEQALLDASLAERDRETAAEAARAAREARLEQRGTRMLRALVAVFAIATIVASGLLVAVWRQSEAAAEERAVATARELAVASAGRLEAQPDLALLLAVEAARATTDRGWITEEALDALHRAIQAARIPYPTEDVAVGVRLTPDGPRGVYLLPADELTALAAAGAGRTLTDAECLTYLHEEPCPTEPAESADDLAVMTETGHVPMETLAGQGSPGANVRVFSQLPADVAGALAQQVTEGSSISVTSDDLATDPTEALGQADIAVLVRPGDVTDLAVAGSLIDLREILIPAEAETLENTPLADLGWVRSRGVGTATRVDRFVGVPLATTASSLLWYPRDAFASAGYEPPETWAELEALTDGMIADGRTPWCLGLAGGEHDGTSGADLVEDLTIRDSTPYRSWATGRLPFDGPAIKTAYRRYHQLVHRDGAVLGGPGAAVRTPVEQTAIQMGTGDLPECWLIHASADQRHRWQGAVRQDLTPVRLPVGYLTGDVLRGRVYSLVVLRDRPEVRSLVRHLLSAEFATDLIARDVDLGIVSLASPEARADRPEDARISAGLVEAAIRAGVFYADASDQMPRTVGSVAFPESTLRVAEAPDPSSASVIAQVLDELEQVRLAARR